jgi:hypothetical protein
MAGKRFERDLRALLQGEAPGDVPIALQKAVADVSRRFSPKGRQMRLRTVAVLAVAAVVVFALAALATALRPPGDLPAVGGLTTPSPSVGGSLHVEYAVVPVGGTPLRQADLDAVVNVMRARLNSTGVASSTVTTQGSDRILVAVAVPADDESVTAPIRSLLGTTGRLDFVPLGDRQRQPGDIVDLTMFPPLFSGDQVDGAKVGANQDGALTVELTLRSTGASLFASYTSEHIGAHFAIVLDGVVLSAPIVKGAITDGDVVVESGAVGGWPLAVARQLVAILASGPLPYPVQEVASNAGLAVQADPQLSISNGTTIPVTLVINGVAIETVAPGSFQDPIAAPLPPRPWAIETRSPSGRVLSTLTVRADAPISSGTGLAVRVDLSCGRLDVWAGPPLSGPAFIPGPSGDCS